MKKTQERRREPRRKVVESFNFFVSIPTRGLHRLTVHDVSESGINFDLDIEGENLADFPVQKDDQLDIRFYLNPSLSIPLNVQIVRISEITKDSVIRQIGAEILKVNTPPASNQKAFLAVIQLIDSLSYM